LPTRAPQRSPHAITECELEQYRADGYCLREGVIPESELEGLREAAERVVEKAESDARAPIDDYDIDGNRYVEAGRSTVQYEHQPGSTTIRVIEPFHFLDPAFDALIADPRIVDPVCGLLGEDACALWTDKINLKRPREGSRFRWHQDSPYWSHACGHCDRLPNVMVTLDDASIENGCFRIIAGSHAGGFLPGIQDETRLGPLFTDPDAFDASREVAFEVRARSLVFFDAHTVHGSQPNRSDRKRRAMVFTYQPPGHPMFKVEGIRGLRASWSRPAPSSGQRRTA
jgi:ectoine hydroxylase